MPDFDITSEVKILLEPINSESPTGQDASKTDAYFKFTQEIGRLPKPDYEICITLATEILQNQSKDLWIASRLCLAWFRMEKTIGLRHGILLISELVKRYSDELFPRKKEQLIKAIQFLDDKRFKTAGKEEISENNAKYFIEIHQLLDELRKTASEVYENKNIKFSVIPEAIAEHVQAAGKSIKDSDPIPPSEKTQENTLNQDENKIEPKTPSKKENVAENPNGSSSDNIDNKESTENAYEISSNVQELLEPVSTPLENLDESQEYQSLVMEMRKMGGLDYSECVNWASTILQEQVKDLRVIAYIALGWCKRKTP